MTVYVRPGDALEVAGPVLRTNLSTDPHGTRTGASGGGWYVEHQGDSGAGTLVPNATALGPDGRAGVMRYTRSAVGGTDDATNYFRLAHHVRGVPAVTPEGYRLSFYIKTNATLRIQAVEVFVGGLSFFIPAVIPGSSSRTLAGGVWHRIDCHTSDVGGSDASTNTGIGVRFAGNAGSGGTLTIEVARALVEPGRPLLPYFDGSGPVAPGEKATWDGTANASSSTLRRIAYAGELEVPLLLEYSATVDARHTYLEVLGRPAPIPIMGPGGARSGALELFTLDHATALAVQALHRHTVAVRDTEYPALGMTYVAPSTTIKPVAEQVAGVRPWLVSVPEFRAIL